MKHIKNPHHKNHYPHYSNYPYPIVTGGGTHYWKLRIKLGLQNLMLILVNM